MKDIYVYGIIICGANKQEVIALLLWTCPILTRWASILPPTACPHLYSIKAFICRLHVKHVERTIASSVARVTKLYDIFIVYKHCIIFKNDNNCIPYVVVQWIVIQRGSCAGTTAEISWRGRQRLSFDNLWRFLVWYLARLQSCKLV